MLISTGSCDDPNCRYAHNRGELKEIPGLPSPLLDQLRETEALRLADAAKAAQRAAAESNDAQRQKSNEQLQQQLRQQLSLLEPLGRRIEGCVYVFIVFLWSTND